MVYPPPENLTGLIPMMQYVNQVTNDTFIVLLLLTVYLIPFIYLLMRRNNWIESSLTAGFILTISAALLRVATITTVDRYLIIGIATIIVPLAFAFLKDTSS